MKQLCVAILQATDECRIAIILIDPSKEEMPQLMIWSGLFEASKSYRTPQEAENAFGTLQPLGSLEIDINPYIVNLSFKDFVALAHQRKMCQDCFIPIEPSKVRIG